MAGKYNDLPRSRQEKAASPALRVEQLEGSRHLPHRGQTTAIGYAQRITLGLWYQECVHSVLWENTVPKTPHRRPAVFLDHIIPTVPYKFLVIKEIFVHLDLRLLKMFTSVLLP